MGDSERAGTVSVTVAVAVAWSRVVNARFLLVRTADIFCFFNLFFLVFVQQ